MKIKRLIQLVKYHGPTAPFGAILALFIIFWCSCQDAPVQTIQQSNSSPWDLAKEIEQTVVVPGFPDTVFSVLDFGVKEGAEINNAAAFAKAIETCHQAGGGKVTVPKGIYHSGAIHLLDHVNLHLEEGAEIRFSTNPGDFLPVVHTSFEGNELMNYSPLVYAYRKKNIAITGKGTLNGQASSENWWTWKGSETYGWRDGMPHQNEAASRPRLAGMVEQGVPVEERIFGEGYYLRPSFVEFLDCQNILIQDIKIINAPFWIIHPIKCSNITVDRVTVKSHGPNNDGCDPEYCKNVVIKNCRFDTGDDCIAIKSGRDEDGRRVGIKSERIFIKNCQMIDGHGGVVIGSEISAGVSDVYVENCTMSSPNLDRAIRIKTNTKRGGLIENLYVRNLEVGQVKEAVLRVNLFYATYSDQQGNFMPEVRNITLENIRVKNGGSYAVLIKGYAESPVKNITLKDVIIEKVDTAFSLEHVENFRLIDTYINGALMQSPLSLN